MRYTHSHVCHMSYRDDSTHLYNTYGCVAPRIAMSHVIQIHRNSESFWKYNTHPPHTHTDTHMHTHTNTNTNTHTHTQSHPLIKPHSIHPHAHTHSNPYSGHGLHSSAHQRHFPPNRSGQNACFGASNVT